MLHACTARTFPCPSSKCLIEPTVAERPVENLSALATIRRPPPATHTAAAARRVSSRQGCATPLAPPASCPKSQNYKEKNHDARAQARDPDRLPRPVRLWRRRRRLRRRRLCRDRHARHAGHFRRCAGRWRHTAGESRRCGTRQRRPQRPAARGPRHAAGARDAQGHRTACAPAAGIGRHLQHEGAGAEPRAQHRLWQQHDAGLGRSHAGDPFHRLR
ncbi:hypothetical protein D9M72_327620 [compost metagenome]